MKTTFRATLLTAALLAPVMAPVLTVSAQAAEPVAGKTAPKAPVQQSKIVESQIAGLHKALDITPAQESDFGALASTMRDNAAKIDAASANAGTDPTKLDAPTIVQGYAKYADARAAAAQAIVDPFNKLYGDLSAEQKQKADKAFQNAPRRHRL